MKLSFLKCLVLTLTMMNLGFAQISKSNSILKEELFFDELKLKTSNTVAFQHVKNLIYNIQDAVYVADNSIKTYGKKPTNLYTNLKDFNLISNDQIIKESVEIFIIKIDSENEVSTTIDINKLSQYKNLKYIYIVSTISINELDLNKLFKEAIGNYKIFYRYDNGDLR